jgi:hypothetical protein
MAVINKRKQKSSGKAHSIQENLSVIFLFFMDLEGVVSGLNVKFEENY